MLVIESFQKCSHLDTIEKVSIKDTARQPQKAQYKLNINDVNHHQ